MGRPAKPSLKESKLWTDAELPEVAVAPGIGNFESLRYPLWTEHKARLIRDYLRLFTMVTRHGAYIDGFAAPQETHLPDTWSAKLVLEAEPKWLREFWLCDINREGIKSLKDLALTHSSKKRKVEVLPGDFNLKVAEILGSGRIKDKTASFALLDQRTFECHWSTVQRLASHKKSNKIELFYFFPSGWLDRSLAAVRAKKKIEQVDRWWGIYKNIGWRDLQGMPGAERAMFVAKRFKEELGYTFSNPYPIHDRKKGGRTMYHMIHATDHRYAPPLMLRSYRKISGRPEVDAATLQLKFDTFWGAGVSES